MTRASKLLAVAVGLSLCGGLIAARAVTGANRAAELRAARSRALPAAGVLLAQARRADICFEKLGAGVYGLHRRGESFRDARITRDGGSTSVSVTAGGITEDQMDEAVRVYQASGQSAELYEHVMEAVDLGLLRRDALRC